MNPNALALTLASDPQPAVDAAANHETRAGLKSRLRTFLFGGPQTKRKIGRFTVEKALGRGGMGTVFLAHDEELDRKVALKLVRADRVSQRAQERLRREARALAKLSHPNVVPVFEVGDHEGMIYVAMEYVVGQDLRHWLDADARPWSEIVAVFEQAGRGLAAAHEAGLVHRDFKPENVVVGQDGRVRVVDFGLVAADGDLPSVQAELAGASNPDLLDVDAPLTQTGELMGTPAYMAPEQFLGEAPTPASDQFSFFAALFEALEDERPFAGDAVPTLMRSVLAGDSRSMTRSELPKALRETVARGLAREPSQRFADMGSALKNLGAPPPRGPFWWTRPALAASAALMLAGVFLPRTCAQKDSGPETETPSVAGATALDGGPNHKAAAASLAALLDAEDDATRIARATAYLDAHAEDGGEARRLIAEATLGGAQWRSSCANADDGLCLKHEPYGAGPSVCTERVAPRYVAKQRDDAAAAEALPHLAKVLSLAERTEAPSDPREAAAYADAVGMARTYLADGELESYLLVEAPGGLEWDAGYEKHQELSQDAFNQFMELKQSRREELVTKYAALKKQGSAQWVVVGARRTALANASLHDALVNIPIPGVFEKDPEQRKAYCDALTPRIEPLRQAALGAYAYCAMKAKEEGLDDAAAKRCAEQAERLRAR